MKKILIYSLAFLAISCSEEDGGFNMTSSEGVGGSMARLTLKGNYLYFVNDISLYSIDISAPEKPHISNHVNIGEGIETIYPYFNHLLIGSFNAMYIYSLEDDPSSPKYVSEFSHWNACDPVVAQNDYAYVTLRSGSGCSPMALNQLDVIDITNPSSPALITSLQMKNPHGLAVSGNKVLVCEGTHGLSWVDITDPSQPVIDSTYTGFHAYDVIIRDHLVIVTGNDGYFQFDCSEGYLKELSEIEFL